MGPDAHHAWSTAAVGAGLAVLEEEVDATIGPSHPPIAVRKTATAADAAYARDDLLEKRRPVTQAWADCIPG